MVQLMTDPICHIFVKCRYDQLTAILKYPHTVTILPIVRNYRRSIPTNSRWWTTCINLMFSLDISHIVSTRPTVRTTGQIYRIVARTSKTNLPLNVSLRLISSIAKDQSINVVLSHVEERHTNTNRVLRNRVLRNRVPCKMSINSLWIRITRRLRIYWTSCTRNWILPQPCCRRRLTLLLCSWMMLWLVRENVGRENVGRESLSVRAKCRRSTVKWKN